MSEITMIVDVQMLEGREEEALEALKELCEQTHANDEGCLLYALCRVAGDPTRAMMIERWTSTEALQSHSGTAHAAKAMSHTAFAGPPTTTVLEASGFGEPAKALI